MELTEKQISEETKFEGRVITLQVCGVELPNGHKSTREVVRHPGGAAVLFVKDGKVLLERQFRFPYNKVIWEIPAGKLNRGENPEHAAIRERLVEIYPSPGYTDEIIYVFLADGADFIGQNLDEDEFINAEFVELKKVEEMVESGEICDAKTIAAVYKYLANRR